MIIIIIIVCIFDRISSYTTINYAISISNVEYIDKESNTINNIQAVIDETCINFSKQLTALETSIIDEIYRWEVFI